MGKPVIVATHMLESMIKNPMPTRAEITDIAHAAHTRADATMLSGETAAGKYPLKSVEMMAKVLTQTEGRLPPEQFCLPLRPAAGDHASARAAAALARAASMNDPLVVVLTRSGETVRAVSRFRPTCPIVAVTPHAQAERQMQILYGVIPLHVPRETMDPEEITHQLFSMLKERGIRKAGDQVVLVCSLPVGAEVVDSIQLRQIP